MVKDNNIKNFKLKNGFKIKTNLKGGKIPTYQELGLNNQIVQNFYDNIIDLGDNFKNYIDNETWDKYTIPDKDFLSYFQKNIITKKGREALDLFALYKAYIGLGYKNINRFLNCKTLDVDELLNDKKIVYSGSNSSKKIKDYELKNIYYDGSYVKNQYFENKLITDEIYSRYIGKDLDVFKYIYIPMALFSNTNPNLNQYGITQQNINQIQIRYDEIIKNPNPINFIDFISQRFQQNPQNPQLQLLPQLKNQINLEYCKYNISSLLHWNSYNPLDQAILSPDLFADGIFAILNHENNIQQQGQQGYQTTETLVHESIAKMSGYLLTNNFSNNPIPGFNAQRDYGYVNIDELYKFNFCLCKPDMYDYDSPINNNKNKRPIFDINWYSYDSFGFMKFIKFMGNYGNGGSGTNQSIINANNNQVYADNIQLAYFGLDNNIHDIFPFIDRKKQQIRAFHDVSVSDDRKKRGLLFLFNNIPLQNNPPVNFYNPIQNTSFAYDTDINYDNYTTSMNAIAVGNNKGGAAGNADNEWGQKRSLRRLHLSGEPTQIYTSTIQSKSTIIRPQSQRNLQQERQRWGFGGSISKNKLKQKGGYTVDPNLINDESNKMYFTGEKLFTFNGNEPNPNQNTLQNKNHEFLRNIFKIQNELLDNTNENVESLDEIKLLAAIHIADVPPSLGLNDTDIKNNVNKLTKYFKIFSYYDFISKLFNQYLTLYINFVENNNLQRNKNIKSRLDEKINKLKEFKNFNFLLGKKLPHEELSTNQEQYANQALAGGVNWNGNTNIRDVNNLLFYFNIDLSESVFLNDEQKTRYKNAVQFCKNKINEVNADSIVKLNARITGAAGAGAANDYGKLDFGDNAKIIASSYQIVFQGALKYLFNNKLRILEGREIDWVNNDTYGQAVQQAQPAPYSTFIMGDEMKIKQNIMKIIISFEQLYREKVDEDFSLSGINLFMTEDKYKTVINSIFLWFIHERASLYKLNKELIKKFDKSLLDNRIKSKIPEEELKRIQGILRQYFILIGRQNPKNRSNILVFEKYSQLLFKDVDKYLFEYFKQRFNQYSELKENIYKINKELSNSTNCNKDEVIENLRENIEELLRVYGGRNSIMTETFSNYHKCQNLLNIIAEQWMLLSDRLISLNVQRTGKQKYDWNTIYSIYTPIFFTELINRKNLLIKFGTKLDMIDIDTPKSKTGFLLYDAETDLDFKKIFDKLNTSNENIYKYIYDRFKQRLYYNPEIYENNYWTKLKNYYNSKNISNIWYPLVIRVNSENSYTGDKTPLRFFLVNLLKWAEKGEIENALILEKEKKPERLKFGYKFVYRNYQNKTINPNLPSNNILGTYELIEWVPNYYRNKIENIGNILGNILGDITTEFNIQQNNHKLLCMDSKADDFKKMIQKIEKYRPEWMKKYKTEIYEKLVVGFDFLFKPINKENIIYEYFQFEPITMNDITNSNRIDEIREFVYKILFNYSSIEREKKTQLNYVNGFINFNNKNPKDYYNNVDYESSYMTFNLYTNNEIMIRKFINMKLSIIDEILGINALITQQRQLGQQQVEPPGLLSSKYVKSLYYNNISDLSKDLKVENIL